MTNDKLSTFVNDYCSPRLQHSLKALKALKKLTLEDKHLSLNLRFGFPVQAIKQSLTEELDQAIRHRFPVEKVSIEIQQKISPHKIQSSIETNKAIKNIIAIGSGKGGVGKSTTSVNLAIALQQAGARVGLLDADIYGPNQPQMLGGVEKPFLNENKKFIPVERYGLQTNSIGYLVPDEKAMIWRGPMVSGALTQLLNDTAWNDLDYLIIDLPPGTGDIQLTLAQKLPVSGAAIVTTPQSVAVADALKAIAMFEKVNIKVLGLIENMAYYQCSSCDKKDYLFGQDGGKQLAEQQQVPFLGELPLQKQIREQADQGQPIVVAKPESDAAKLYREIALQLAIQLSLQPKNMAYNMPGVKVEHSK